MSEAGERARIRDEREGVADERDGIADERDGIADVRDAIADAREEAWIRWEATCKEIGKRAERRDRTADERDAQADRREVVALHDDDPGDRDADQLSEARALAKKDRAHAKSNRIASSVDRFQLTFFTPGSAERRAATKRRIAAAARREADAMRVSRLVQRLAMADVDPTPDEDTPEQGPA